MPRLLRCGFVPSSEDVESTPARYIADNGAERSLRLISSAAHPSPPGQEARRPHRARTLARTEGRPEAGKTSPAATATATRPAGTGRPHLRGIKIKVLHRYSRTPRGGCPSRVHVAREIRPSLPAGSCGDPPRPLRSIRRRAARVLPGTPCRPDSSQTGVVSPPVEGTE